MQRVTQQLRGGHGGEGELFFPLPDAFVDSSLSASLNRASSDQEQVQLLKEQAYKAAAEAFVARFAG